jgi:hypothetical protein
MYLEYQSCIFYFNISIYDLAYAQFHQDPLIGLPEDGAPAAPKHVRARFIFHIYGLL